MAKIELFPGLMEHLGGLEKYVNVV